MLNRSNNIFYENNNLIELVNFISSQKDSDIVLQDIFDWHLKNMNDNLIQNLTLHLNKSFGIPCDLIIDYIRSDNYINTQNVKNIKFWNCLNMLKKKYGFLIDNMYTKNRNPFSFLGLSLNLDKEETRFNLKIHRADDESFSVLVNSSDLLGIITFISINLNKIIDSGIYNLNIENINQFITVSDETSLKLKQLLKKTNK